jgi:hypothetical protein
MVNRGVPVAFVLALAALADPATASVHKNWHLESPVKTALKLRGGALPSDRGDVPLLEVYPEIKPIVVSQSAAKPPITKSSRRKRR